MINYLSFEMEGSRQTGSWQRIGQTIWIHFNGKTWAIDDPSTSRRRRPSGANPSDLSNQILAPMPGKITKIEVQTGDPLAPGQVAVVMEAMKMEYTLKAKRAATVSQICCQVGDQVSLGQRLVELKP